MKIAAFTLLLVASASASHYRSSESTLVDLWGQCGGETYLGDIDCTGGNYCKKINEYYSQCQPGGTNVTSVGRWGQCGGNGFTGTSLCEGSDKCQVWNDNYSQCIPSMDAEATAVPDNWVVSKGVCHNKCQGDDDTDVGNIATFEGCVAEAVKRGRYFAVWKNNKCQVLRTVYTYSMDPACTSAAYFDKSKYTCSGNSDYYGNDIGNTQTRFDRCLDACEYYTSGGKNCNAVTYVQMPGNTYFGTCFFKYVPKDAQPVKNDMGGAACKLIKST
ncbi:hypothetical protein THRCLA_08878 [Thraustotheca clavata]|uniref:Secreted protein n=1 Tax=Thraustotheca clavata TaxID=74557 RepID=A0A0A7CM82_9STRA|nr:secreted protein [Thraustotheca clavata]OQR91782.1 hypothetical protein THRCLA_08878 [Thraustotheca clavata]